MMYRILNVRQEKNRDFKIWYTDDYWDLFLWIDAKKQVSAFQLCFGKPDNEHIIMWNRKGNTIKTARVESGEDDPSQNRSPLLYEAGNVNIHQTVLRFEKDSKKMDPALAKLVISRLKASG
ncbi:MAG: hypothetical protein JXB03_02915 [Spirochaetales bacterium]|nr:hypothetical protein [Spirochaetales bacterium]